VGARGEPSARGFYEHASFAPTGERRHIDLGAPLPEIKYLLQGQPPQTGSDTMPRRSGMRAPT
jgi:hypothetical protein